ncbi:MAG: VanZ family protein [Eggerthellaceae bacterium]|nr:VanZ family protein [Eggerthellaceae bacterium]
MNQAVEESEKPKTNHKTLYTAIGWICVVAWACFIFFMSAHTGSELDGTGFIADVKRWLVSIQVAITGSSEPDLISPLCHFLEYALFGFLLYIVLRLSGVQKSYAIIFALLIGSAYGVTDEFHQLFIADRQSDPLDWAIDTFGTLLGALIGMAIKR